MVDELNEAAQAAMRKIGCTIEKHDLIQIVPSHKWGGCIAVVDEPKWFGCQAYVTIPRADPLPPGPAYIRLNWDEFQWLGAKALFVTD